MEDSFLNAPALSTDNRYKLGQLARGEKCPLRQIFEPFQQEKPNGCAGAIKGTSTQQEEPDGEIELMEGTSTRETRHFTSVLPLPDEAELAQVG